MLTPRQRDILNLICLGRSNREIGTALGLTVGTVKVYVSRLYDKVDVRNRVELVLAAHGKGRF